MFFFYHSTSCRALSVVQTVKTGAVTLPLRRPAGAEKKKAPRGAALRPDTEFQDLCCFTVRLSFTLRIIRRRRSAMDPQ
ncbi:uncharacterized [Tachysurus ichikawai]